MGMKQQIAARRMAALKAALFQRGIPYREYEANAKPLIERKGIAIYPVDLPALHRAMTTLEAEGAELGDTLMLYKELTTKAA